MNADQLIQKLQLTKHPERGYYQEIYRASETINADALPERYTSNRTFGTSIYFLLKSEDISHFHRLQSDEIWHFYAGSPLILHMINSYGDYSTIRLGSDIENGELFQCVVKADTWFGATVLKSDSFSLVGCTMTPGFDFEDFELGKRNKLLQLYPQHKSIIQKLTKTED